MDNNPQPAQPTDSPQPQPQPEPQSQPLPQYQSEPQLQPQQPPTPTQPTQIQRVSPKQPNKNLLTIILASVGGLAIIVAVVLVIIFSAANQPGASDQNPNENNNSNNNSGNNNSSNNNNTEQPNSQEVVINKTIIDPELGYKIIVKKAIFDVPFKDSHYSENYKSVAVEITIENNSKYYNSFSSYDLKLIINGQSQTSTEYQFENYVDSEDITFIPYSTAQGNTSSGWIFFQYEKKLKGTLEFTYDRTVKTTTDGETIPAKKFTIPLN